MLTWKCEVRFQQLCRRVKVEGVSLHSYRYAWAERPKSAGMPERFAQQALGHNSVAVHRSYAKKAKVLLPSLEEYEKKMVPLPQLEKSQAASSKHINGIPSGITHRLLLSSNLLGAGMIFKLLQLIV